MQLFQQFKIILQFLVIEFAKKTGDYASLSKTDLYVIALTYTIELETCGSKNIQTEPKVSLSLFI